MDNVIIVVNDEPYSIWDVNIAERNLEYLKDIDADYFEYLNEAYQKSDDKKRASIALRSSLHHATETLFSLIGALLQAPTAVYAWMPKCSNADLRSLVKKINHKDDSLFVCYRFSQLSWRAISETVFQWYLPGTDKQKITIELFAKLWQRLSHEFEDPNHVNEYNSIKHGFRIRSGGFSLAIGQEKEYGVAPPASEMQLIGKSDHGTSFFVLKEVGGIKGNRSLTSRRISLNWKFEKVALLLQLVSMSINNVTSALMCLNGVEAEKCKFTRPVEDSDFSDPWTHLPGVTSCNFDLVIDESKVPKTGRKELLEEIKKYQAELKSPPK